MPVSQKLQDFAGTPTRVVIFLFVALVLIALMGIAITQRGGKTTPTKNNPNAIKKDIVTLSPHTLIYGSWTSNRSIITAYDLSTGREGIIAVLPVNIKKVTVTSPNTLLFISSVANAQDHGREIVEYNLLSQTQKTVYKASEGFGIDDYVISPDFHTIAVWEAQLDKEVGTLLNGKSRVYTMKLGEETKYIIYDESVSETNPAHYPLAITNNGTVFMDRFLPNSGAGWAYGMSVSNFNGSEKKDLDSMQNGTYSTQPVLSPNGKYLAFAGYDGSKGSGTSEVEGFRRALVVPNTVELLDTTTYERIKQENIPNTNIYPVIGWNDNTSLFVVSQGQNTENTGTLSYNIETNVLSQSNTPKTDDEQYLVQELSDSAWLVGHQDASPSLSGNLGETYEAPYTIFSIYNPQTKKLVKLHTATELKQLIAVLPATSFGSFATIINIRQPNENNLQLKTFSVKSELAPTREEQQSTPRCRDLARTMCSNDGRLFCTPLEVGIARSEGRCYDSPLYLYGNSGQKVKVTILTPVSNASPVQNGNFTATLKSNGNMEVDGNEYDSIDFDYTSAIKRFTPPSYGSIVQKSQLTKTVKQYSDKLGLNEKETNDLIQYATSVAKGKYIFVSFFDHKTSHAILPITFDPKPDVYRNIVFYFKNLDQKPNISINPPTFDPIKRHGLTAIEISGIAE